MAELKRNLSGSAMLAIGIQGGLGTGAFFSTAAMAGLAGPGVVIAYVGAAIVFALISLGYLELVSQYPEAGGPARYGLYSHGAVTNLIPAVSNIIWYLFIPPIEAVATVEGISYYVPSFLTKTGNLTVTGALLTAAIVLVAIPINYFGMKVFSRITNGLTWPKNVLYVLVVLLFLGLLAKHGTNLTADGGFAPAGVKGILLAVPLGIFSFGGVRLISDYAGDSSTVGLLRRMMIITIVVEAVVLTLFGLAFVMALDWHSVGLRVGSWSSISTIAGNPFVDLASKGGLGWLVVLTVIAAILGPFVASYLYLGAGSRVLLSMSRSGYVGGRLGRINPESGTPVAALLIVAAVGTIIALLTAPIPTIYGLIGDAVAIGYVAFAIVPVAMVVVANRQAPDGAISYGRFVFGALGFGAAALAVYWSGWPSVPYGAILLVVLLVVFGSTGRVRAELGTSRGAVLRTAFWYPLYVAFLVLVAGVGSVGAGTEISFTVGTIIVAGVSIFLFFPIAVLMGQRFVSTTGAGGVAVPLEVSALQAGRGGEL